MKKDNKYELINIKEYLCNIESYRAIVKEKELELEQAKIALKQLIENAYKDIETLDNESRILFSNYVNKNTKNI